MVVSIIVISVPRQEYSRGFPTTTPSTTRIVNCQIARNMKFQHAICTNLSVLVVSVLVVSVLVVSVLVVSVLVVSVLVVSVLG